MFLLELTSRSDLFLCYSLYLPAFAHLSYFYGFKRSALKELLNRKTTNFACFIVGGKDSIILNTHRPEEDGTPGQDGEYSVKAIEQEIVFLK